MDHIDYMLNKLPKCPHCAKDFDIWDGDNSYGLNHGDGRHTHFDCDHCGKEFVCVTVVDYKFNTAIDTDHADDEEWGPHPAEDGPFTTDEVEAPC